MFEISYSLTAYFCIVLYYYVTTVPTHLQLLLWSEPHANHPFVLAWVLKHICVGVLRDAMHWRVHEAALWMLCAFLVFFLGGNAWNHFVERRNCRISYWQRLFECAWIWAENVPCFLNNLFGPFFMRVMYWKFLALLMFTCHLGWCIGTMECWVKPQCGSDVCLHTKLPQHCRYSHNRSPECSCVRMFLWNYGFDPRECDHVFGCDKIVLQQCGHGNGKSFF